MRRQHNSMSLSQHGIMRSLAQNARNAAASRNGAISRRGKTSSIASRAYGAARAAAWRFSDIAHGGSMQRRAAYGVLLLAVRPIIAWSRRKRHQRRTVWRVMAAAVAKAAAGGAQLANGGGGNGGVMALIAWRKIS